MHTRAHAPSLSLSHPPYLYHSPVLLLELPELRVDVEGPPEVTLPLLVPVLRQVAQPVEQLLTLLEQVAELENDFALMVVHASHHDHLFGESRPRPDAGWTPFSTTRSRRARVMAPGDSATLLHGAYDDGDHGNQSILLPTPHQGEQRVRHHRRCRRRRDA